MKTLFGISLFLALFLYAGASLHRSDSHSAYDSLCRLVSTRYYQKNEKLVRWKSGCEFRAKNFRARNKDHLIARLRDELSLLGGSHLELYAPIENNRLWRGESGGDTGLRARFVEGELVIHQVLRGSSAESLGLQSGDIIKSINGEHPHNESAQSEAGEFLIKKLGGGTEKYQLVLKTLMVDEAPVIQSLGQGRAYLKVPSFRGELFSTESIEALSERLAEFQKGIVLDLRSNLGGNLIAGMRLLGSLTCEKKEVGSLLKSAESGREREATLLNELADDSQLKQISLVHEVRLQSYPPTDCARVPVVVLIDHNSSSTSEIVAQALRQHWGAPLLGTPTAGQVLIAVWYDFPELGEGYSLSIPERRYVSSEGDELEGVGVYPDQTLYYKLADALAGKDSWVEKAVEHLAQ